MGVDAISAIFKNKAVQGTDFGSNAAIQVAAVRTDAPGDWATFGTWLQDAGEQCDAAVSVSATSDQAMFMRLGIAWRMTTSGSRSSADVSLQAAYNAAGQIVGNAAEQLVALDENTDQYMILTDWIPEIYAAKVKAAFVLSQVDSDFVWSLVYQTAYTSVDSPDSWSADLFTERNQGAEEYNSGDITLNISSKGWVRFALRYSVKATTSSVNQQAYVKALVGVRCA